MAMFHTNVLDNTIKALPTIKAISNTPIATFDTDMTENLIEVVCDIQYTQASGTPSPSNPLKIYTSDHCSIFHNSINLWNEQWELGQYDINTGEKATNNNAIRSKDFIPIRAGTNQKVYFQIPNGVRLYFYGKNKNYLGSSYSFVVNAPQEITFTLASAYYFTFYTGNTTTYGNNISINYPSTEHGYNAFSGAYIPFGQTVYGGSLDVLTGKLTITHGAKIYDGTENWNTSDTANFYSASGRGGDTSAYYGTSKLICSHCLSQYASASLTQPNCYIATSGNLNIQLPSDVVAHTGADMKAWCLSQYNNGTPLTICYELKTPTTIQLDSEEVQAIIGNNNIYADTGDIINLKYQVTVGKAIS